MPNMVIAMPYDAKEAFNLLYYAFMSQKNPMVIRYPRGLVEFDTSKDVTFDEIKPTWTHFKKR